MSDTRANVEITASSNRLAAGLRAAAARFQTWGQGVRSSMKKIGEGAAGSFAGNLGANLAGRGIDMITEQARSVISFERNLVRFQITANKTPASMVAFRQSVRDVSRETAISSDDVLAGAQAYVDITGDVAGASENMRTFARVAQASGSNMSDVATAAASMMDAMHVDPKSMEAVFSGLINQGKAGAVTLKDFAGEFTGLLPRFARFKELGAAGVLELGAMFQVGRKGFKNAEETGTGMAAMLGGLIKHADRFKAAGVNVFDIGKDGTKTLRPISAIIEEIGKSKLAKDPTLLNKAFGRGEGEQIYQMLKGHVDMLHQMEEAGQDAGTVGRDMLTMMESPSGKLDAALNNLKISVAETFTPDRIRSFAEAVQGAADHVGTLTSALGKVFGFLGGLNSIGKSVRVFFDSNEKARERFQEDQTDKGVISSGGDMGAGGVWNTNRSDAEKAAQVQAAKTRIANRDAYEKAKNDIFGSEVDEKSSPASIKAAWAAKYATGAGALGTNRAGAEYMRNTGAEDPVAVAIRTMQAITNTGQQSQIAAALRDGFNSLAKGLGITVRIGDNQVAKAAANATNARAGKK